MINIAIKLATSITYTADGSQTNFSIPFDYLRPSFVHVAINDAEVSEGFTVSNRGIMFDTAPAKDAFVKIYRKTPTSRLVSWADASILKAIDMTIAEVQQLHILEETSDWTKTNSMALNDEGTAWQGWKHRIENVADPIEAQDVVTKHYLDNEEGSFTATMNALKTKTEEAASTAETNAKQARFNAEKADSAAVGANRDAATALKSANNAKTSETNAGNFATSAGQSASEAQNYRDAAKNYATNAKNYSENVNVFVPSVSTDGILSWSNKAGLTNPPSVNIKGKDGADGGVTVDDALSDTSTNAIQNKVVKAALDNRAILDDANTFTSPNKFDDIYMADGMSSLKWYNGSPNFVVASINSERYTGEANTAKKATKDGDGNIITDTYATKTEFNSCVKTVNNVAPDMNGNVNITVSGGGGSNITVDTALSSTSTNAIANKAVYSALSDKLGKTETAYAATKATQDGAGSVITDTYAKKTDVSGMVKSVNNTKPDSNGNVTITVSGGGSNVTVDTTLSSTSTNAIANKAVYDALNKKLDKTGTVYEATKATQDGYGNVIATTYARKVDLYGYVKSVNNVTPDDNGNVTITVSSGSDITVDEELSSTSTNAIANKAVYTALQSKLGKNDSVASATKATQDSEGNTIATTYVKFINGIAPDTSGNVNVNADGGGVSTSVVNNWSAQQTFQRLKFNFESFTTSRISGTYDSPATSVAVYNVTGAFTVDMSTLTGMLANNESTLFTAYIASNASYTLSITNAGTLKHVGSAADLAITNSGLLLNVLLTKNTSGDVTSIAQASKLS